jgi:hypothetical protein
LKDGQDNKAVTPADVAERWYLTKYPDVARAIEEGRFTTGHDHYAQHGIREGRLAPPGANWSARDTARKLSSQAPGQVLGAMANARLPKGGGIRSMSPRTSREMLGMFAGYEEKQGLASVLDRIDHHPSDVSQIYWAVLSRWPDPSEYRDKSTLTSRAVYESLILSKDFQTNIVKYLLEAYSDKRRFLFVHVPKCAGSDFSNILSQVVPSIHQTLSVEAWTSPERLFAVLRNLVLDLERATGILVHGHHTLQWFRDNHLNRLGDRLFTIIRDPWERLLSHINYIVTRLDKDRCAADTDTRQWLSQLGMTTPLKVDLEELALRILRQSDLITKNGLCAQFGHASCSGALANLTQCEIEITETSRYNQWLEDTWGIRSATKINQSQPILTRQSVKGRDHDRIESLISEDMKLFSLVRSKLEESGESFVRGVDLT